MASSIKMLPLAPFIFIIIYLATFVSLAKALLMDEKIRNDNLPEYSEYLKLIGHPHPATTAMVAPAETVMQNSPNIAASFPQFPQLCKETPEDGDYLGHAYCWMLMVISLLLMVALIIYQVRSILWLKEELADRQALKRIQKQRDIEANGHFPDQ